MEQIRLELDLTVVLVQDQKSAFANSNVLEDVNGVGTRDEPLKDLACCVTKGRTGLSHRLDNASLLAPHEKPRRRAEFIGSVVLRIRQRARGDLAAHLCRASLYGGERQLWHASVIEDQDAGVVGGSLKDLSMSEVDNRLDRPSAGETLAQAFSVVELEKGAWHDETETPMLSEQGKAALDEWDVSIKRAVRGLVSSTAIGGYVATELLNAYVGWVADDRVKARIAA
jgi:hypothetical protein